MKNNEKTFTFAPIGFIETPFSQKFGIPRQSAALSAAKGRIRFVDEINPTNACRGLDDFSHLWLSFVFDQHLNKPWHDTVRPPRLGGNKRMGVFASRATHRPNPIGLSLVKNMGLNDQNELVVGGVDLLDRTPILDIKPYLDYADVAENAICGYAEAAPSHKLTVVMSEQIRTQVVSLNSRFDGFSALLECVLTQDPRPAYKHALLNDRKEYVVRLYGVDIVWHVDSASINVVRLSIVSL